MSLRAYGLLLRTRRMSQVCRQAHRAATFALSLPLQQLQSPRTGESLDIKFAEQHD